MIDYSIKTRVIIPTIQLTLNHTTMKNILVLIVLCACSFTFSKAQTGKGRVFVGVSSTYGMAGTGSDLMTLGFSSTKNKSDTYDDDDPSKTTSFNVLPKVGYFVIDNLAVGLDVNIATSTEKDGDYKTTQTLLSAGPFVRYYIPSEKVWPFAELGGSLGSIKYKYGSGSSDSENKSSANSIWGGVGMAVPVGNHVTFDVLAGYRSITLKDKEDNDDNYRTVMGTVGVEVGIIVLLGSVE